MSPAAQFAGRKAARESREALRTAIDRLELALIERTLAAAEAEDEERKACAAALDATETARRFAQERDLTATQLRAMRAKGGAL